MSSETKETIKIRCHRGTNPGTVSFRVDREKICQMYTYWRDITKEQKKSYHVDEDELVVRYIIEDVSGIETKIELDDEHKVKTWILMYRWGKDFVPSDLIDKRLIPFRIQVNRNSEGEHAMINRLKKSPYRSGIFNSVPPLRVKKVDIKTYFYLISSYLWENINGSRGYIDINYGSPDYKFKLSEPLVNKTDRYRYSSQRIFFVDDIEFLEDILFCLSSSCFKAPFKNLRDLENTKKDVLNVNNYVRTFLDERETKSFHRNQGCHPSFIENTTQFDTRKNILYDKLHYLLSMNLSWVFEVFETRYSTEFEKRTAMYERFNLMAGWYRSFMFIPIFTDLVLYNRWISQREQKRIQESLQIEEKDESESDSDIEIDDVIDEDDTTNWKKKYYDLQRLMRDQIRVIKDWSDINLEYHLA